MIIDRSDDLSRISDALAKAGTALERFTAGDVKATAKSGGDPVTEADLLIDAIMKGALLDEGEGWLSEETADDTGRLERSRVWVVDPLDGTREFVEGIPEWCVSIGLVENGEPVAGGVLAPGPDHLILGAVGHGVTLNGSPVGVTSTAEIDGALVLASRSEVKRGEWDRFFRTPVSVRNMGSVAYKLGLVAAGLADATWTLVPKNEWDVVGGAALVVAGGGQVRFLDGSQPQFNRPDPLLTGFLATNGMLMDAVQEITQ
ncbi:MAG: 3'(2'),5'-bisphosphate nucleotidase CysQ [Acidimicrobiia bacterium]